VIQQGPFRLGGVAGVELEARPSQLDTRHPVARVRSVEPEREILARGRFWIAGVERDVIEVVLDLRGRSDDVDAQALAELEPAFVSAVRAQGDVLQRSLLARALLGEQGQLEPARIDAEQREPVGAVDRMHAELGDRTLGDRVAVRDPERDVVDGARRHRGQVSDAATPCVDAYFRRSTARWSWAFVIVERPSIPIRLASL
jgi:hypothetical protein